MSEFKIVLSDFEGPLDLLLHLIKDSKINIYDIPIAKVTQQYIDFLNNMQKLELDIAGDYLIMASTLMSIKSKLLLPKSKMDEEEFEEVDPREDLVSQLLTYQTFKKASAYFSNKENDRNQYFTKEMSLPSTDIKPFLKENSILISDLTAVMADIVKRQKKQSTTSSITNDNYTIEQAQDRIINQLMLSSKNTESFKNLLHDLNSADELVTSFMAILVLAKNEKLRINQEKFGADIFVSIRSNDEVSS